MTPSIPLPSGGGPPWTIADPRRWPEGKPTKRTPSKGIVLEDLGRDDSQLLEQDIMQDGMALG